MKLFSRCKELEEQFKLKDDENGKLQDEMDEKDNEIEVCCSFQAHMRFLVLLAFSSFSIILNR